TAHTGRAHFNHRAVLAAATAEEARALLEALARGEDPAAVVRNEARKPPKVAFLFTGQGSQYVGMAQELYASQPGFRQALDCCADLLRGQMEKPLLEVL